MKYLKCYESYIASIIDYTGEEKRVIKNDSEEISKEFEKEQKKRERIKEAQEEAKENAEEIQAGSEVPESIIKQKIKDKKD